MATGGTLSVEEMTRALEAKRCKQIHDCDDKSQIWQKPNGEAFIVPAPEEDGANGHKRFAAWILPDLIEQVGLDQDVVH